MEARGGGAVGAGCGEVAQWGAWDDCGADADRGYDRLVGGAEWAVGDDDDAAAGQRRGVRDLAGGCGADLLAGGASQVQTAVAGEPGFGWWFEAADDLGPWIEGPDRSGLRWRQSRLGRGQGGLGRAWSGLGRGQGGGVWDVDAGWQGRAVRGPAGCGGMPG